VINLERVATFLAVVNQGGFREAAKHTGLSQPAVTQHVKRLEESLNVNLIVRSNAGSTLTAEGRAFLPYAENLVRTGTRARALFDANRLVIGASSNIGIYLLPLHLKRFKETTSFNLDVVISDNVSIANKLENFEIDVAVMEWWDQRPGFEASSWQSEELVVIVPVEHPWAKLGSIPLDWLKGEKLLGGEAGSGTGRLLQQYFGSVADSIGISMQLGSTEAVKRAVQAGLGISLVMAASVADECDSGRLSSVRIEGVAPSKKLYVICRGNLLENAPSLQFKNFLLQ
jgi:DNA-binding transcriptional LysR family regulator